MTHSRTRSSFLVGLGASLAALNPEPLIAALSGQAAVKQAVLILPGQPVAITAEPGDRLAFASMFVQSNDLFYAPAPAGLAFFAGRPSSGARGERRCDAVGCRHREE
jgi:hypothetical protein